MVCTRICRWSCGKMRAGISICVLLLETIGAQKSFHEFRSFVDTLHLLGYSGGVSRAPC
jgi:hypothetical protein